MCGFNVMAKNNFQNDKSMKNFVIMEKSALFRLSILKTPGEGTRPTIKPDGVSPVGRVPSPGVLYLASQNKIKNLFAGTPTQ